MSDRAHIASILQRLEVALIADDGPATLLVAKELANHGKSASARANRTNKNKSIEKALAEWKAETGVGLMKLVAIATLLRESATDGQRKWRMSVECALMVLRPDLSHRRGIFRPGAEVPMRLRPPADQRARRRLDGERDKIVRKLAEIRRYSAGPLAPFISTIEAKGTNLTSVCH